jgi:c-di-GMP-binding flagellar brake protein YcgR
LEKLTSFEKYIQVNQKLLIEVKVGDHPGVYDSRIEDFDDEHIFVSMPTDKGVTVPLRPKSRLHVSFVMDRGRFSFKTMVVDRIKGNLPMLKIVRPDAIFRQELRSFFRVDTRMSIKILVDVESDGIITQKVYDAKVLDLSGGGARIFTSAYLKKDDNIEVYFLGNLDRLEEVKAHVRRVRKVEDNYEVGIQFTELGQSDRDKVIKYVFKRQVEMRKLMG